MPQKPPNRNALFLTVTIALSAVSTFAQDLPGKQRTGLRAPTSVTINGALDEWDTKFQVYDKNVMVFYSLANDGNNVYLVLQSTNPLIYKKIIYGGVCFILKDAEKSKNEAVSVTFPSISVKEQNGIKVLPSKAMGNPLDSVINKRKADSMAVIINGQIVIRGKIKINGPGDLRSTSAFAVNNTGIKAAGLLDGRGVYSCEFSVPVKYFNGAKKLDYTILLEGYSSLVAVSIDNNGKNILRRSFDGSGGGVSVPLTPTIRILEFPSSVKGTYSLIK